MATIYPSYVKTPVDCDCRDIEGTDYRLRYVLNVELENSCSNSNRLLYILMNPSVANESISDKTVNKCAHHAFHDLKHLEIGSFSIVNIHPFYESNSLELQPILTNLKSNFPEKYLESMNCNLKTIHQAIKDSHEIFLCTGNVPKSIINKREYRSLVRSVHSYIESESREVYLVKGDRNQRWYGDGHLSHHLNPKVGRINKAKKHGIKNNKFIDLPHEPEVNLSIY